jgi:hypothetical protein
MSHSLHFWALPPSSSLFRRLQTEKAFVALVAALFHYGRGIFYFFEDEDAQQREEILGDVLESRRYALGSGAEARRSIDDFRLELNRTRAAYPGIEQRAASLEGTSEAFAERLAEEFSAVLGQNAGSFVEKLMFGDQVLGRDLGLRDEDVLGLATADSVREAAGLLSHVNAEALFTDGGELDEWQLEHFRNWRQLFKEAATNGEILLIGFC